LINNRLEIVDFKEAHNHIAAEDLIRHYPERRRLSQSERVKLRDLVDMKVSTSSLVKYLRDATGKFITTKDVCNIR